MSHNTKNYMKQGGDEWVIEGKLAFGEDAVVTGLDGATVASAATKDALGGIKAATKGAGETVEIKIDATSAKLYAPTYPVLPTAATADDAGLVKMAANVPLLSEESPEDEVTAAEYNLLVQALIAAGVIAPAAGDGDST